MEEAAGQVNSEDLSKNKEQTERNGTHDNDLTNATAVFVFDELNNFKIKGLDFGIDDCFKVERPLKVSDDSGK